MSAKKTWRTIAVSDIIPTKDNPRRINENAPEFKVFIESVRAQGVIVPPHVRTHPTQEAKYELMAGERRLRAAQLAGIEKIGCLDHGPITDDKAFEVTYTENFGREDLTPLERGRAAAILLEKHNDDAAAVASLMGKSERWVRTMAHVDAGLSEVWKDAITNEEPFTSFTTAHLAVIARFPAETQGRILKTLKKSYFRYDDISVAALEKEVTDELRLLKKAPFDTEKCQSCSKRSGVYPTLWEEVADKASGDNDKCLDRKCWERKEAAVCKAKLAELQEKHGEMVCVATGQPWGDEARRLKAKYGRYLNSYDYDKCKKGDKRAVAALVIQGKGKGRVQYVKLRQTAKARNKDDENKKPTVRQLRQQLNEKRWRQTLKEVAAIMRNAEMKDLKENVDAGNLCLLTLLHFIPRVYGVSCDISWGIFADNVCSKDAEATQEKLIAQKWKSIMSILAYACEMREWDHDVRKYAKRAKVIAPLFEGIDLDEVYRDVCGRDEFREPAEWSQKKKAGKAAKKAKKTKRGSKKS